ncbi:uncharacterized protein LOC131347336 isoform X1 [Hemibagrus wyckioides]|uniref:uncharacterized protein LOC131347336 isoform X1 n=2 Tax=Hemibagrus wyckioides TaxID=337641 RepID=UPI00266CC919|nr:uncharacterized protein LOC131347336 isoform X1 [Hemibagrus wyckioides]
MRRENSFPVVNRTMDFGARIMLLILLVYVTVSVSGIQNLKVSCSHEKICALRDSSVNLTCSYSNIITTTGFWFSFKDKAKWREEEHPEDLALDSDYAGRVNYTEVTNSRSTLTITDLRERDTGEYRFMLITDKGEKYVSSAGVTLTVTDLQVIRDYKNKALICHTSCNLTFAANVYYWYKDGQYIQDNKDTQGTFPLSNDEEVSYSCSVHGYNEIRAPSLCVGRNCLNVTYPDKRVCVLEGSSVEIAGNYMLSSGQSVKEIFWHSSKDFKDLKHEFTNRVEYVKQDRNCALKMNQLRKKDSGEYRLRVVYTSNRLSGRPGVVLNVTDLQVRLSHYAGSSEERTTVTLSCITSCTLSNSPTYLWYKNGQPVTDKLTKHNKLYLISSEDAGNYSCAVKGHEDLRSPEQTVTQVDLCPGFNKINQIPIIAGTAVVLVLLIIVGALWMWRRKSKSGQSHSSTEDPDLQSGQVCVTHQDDVHYSSILFSSRTQGSSLTTGGTKEYERVQYAEVKYKRPAAAT